MLAARSANRGKMLAACSANGGVLLVTRSANGGILLAARSANGGGSLATRSANGGESALPPACALLGRYLPDISPSLAVTASPIWAVETGVPPSGPIRSAVRTPSASTPFTARSSRSA